MQGTGLEMFQQDTNRSYMLSSTATGYPPPYPGDTDKSQYWSAWAAQAQAPGTGCAPLSPRDMGWFHPAAGLEDGQFPPHLVQQAAAYSSLMAGQSTGGCVSPVDTRYQHSW